MPHFEDNPLNRLALQAGDVDAELDLRGLPHAEALSRVEELLQGGEAIHGGSILLRFDPASGDGRETLFLPLGRRLLEARRAGQLKSCLPTAEGDGYVIVLIGSPQITH